jgi:hypothetical protein
MRVLRRSFALFAEDLPHQEPEYGYRVLVQNHQRRDATPPPPPSYRLCISHQGDVPIHLYPRNLHVEHPDNALGFIEFSVFDSLK